MPARTCLMFRMRVGGSSCSRATKLTEDIHRLKERTSQFIALLSRFSVVRYGLTADRIPASSDCGDRYQRRGTAADDSWLASNTCGGGWDLAPVSAPKRLKGRS